MGWVLAHAFAMAQVRVHVPDEALVALGVGPARIGEELLLAAAVQWLESGRLSSGAAAELAGLSKPEFIEGLRVLGVAVLRQSEEELREEAANP